MHSREKSQRPYFRIVDPAMAASRTTGSRGFYPALTIPRLVIVIYALYGRSTSGSTRTVLNAVDHRGWSSHMATVLRITAYHAHTHTHTHTLSHTGTHLPLRRRAHKHIDELIPASSREGVYATL